MKHSKALFVSIALVALLALAPMGLVSADGHCEFDDYTIKLGGLAPMSAPGAVAGGVAMDWAFKQAAADINADCGVQIDGVNYMLEVITGDSEGSPERGQAVAER
ncbi:MAG: ABC transporter substrate-binding protein, partial [Chloroflexi bacterium]|nr:ABC transporter substrate-binding protein [Chloroflexota bacterium]